MATRAAPTRFQGFADTDGRFFRALAKHQDRNWFAAHKHEYEQGWVEPMRLLLAEVREQIDPLFAHHPLGDPKVFRIYRDVRFSKDKSPFKTTIGAYVPLSGVGHGPGAPVPVYVQLGTETFVGAGHYMMDPGQLTRFRAAVLDDAQGKALVRIVAALEKAGFSLESFATLKKVPRGFDPEHPRADLLRRKSLAVGFPTLPKRLLVSRALIGWLVKQTEKARPLVEWLADVTA
ncbi:MAG TPA: DUF2461 domain-containing protein [Candidatus Eisenbacteria bacterium]|nr:DUF2461 domain-containing protein [Candidatus Eisenbacteria bacterium]